MLSKDYSGAHTHVGLNAPVEFDALPQDRHFALTAQSLVLAVTRDIGVYTRRKRPDDDTVQHRTDSGTPAIGIP